MEEIGQGIHDLRLDLVLDVLHLRHAIHVVFGSSDLQPLTAGELSLAEEILSGMFNIPSAKEAKSLLEGVVSLSQKKKRKRSTLPDTKVVDNHAATKISVAKASAAPFATPTGTLQATTSTNPSPAKFLRKARSKSTESEGTVMVPIRIFAVGLDTFNVLTTI